MRGNQANSEEDHIFVDRIPFVEHQVPLVFYVPDCDERLILTNLIEKYGGIVTDMHECFTYQIHPLYEQLEATSFYKGEVYKATWITDSIKEGVLLNKEDYYYTYSNEEKKNLRLSLPNKCGFTITEAIKIQEIADQDPKRCKGANFWKEVEGKAIIPQRSSDSMRNFLKTKLNHGLEPHLKQCVSNNTKFSHALQNIPRSRMNVQLSKDDTHYLNTAIWNEHQFKQMKKSVDNFMKSRPQTTFSAANPQIQPPSSSSNNNKNQRATDIVTYDLKDLGQTNHQHNSLDQIFNIIDKAKSGQQNANSDKENLEFNINSQEYLNEVKNQGIIVYKKNDEEKRQVNLSKGEEAFFAMLATDMVDLGDKYKRDVDEVHKMFFEVNCDREKLIKLLEGQKVDKWQLIEDLAVKDDPSSMTFKYVVQQKGEQEVMNRRRFLEIE